MNERLHINKKVEPPSTFTFMAGFSHITSISFMLVKYSYKNYVTVEIHFTVPFNDMRNLKLKSQSTSVLFPAIKQMFGDFWLLPLVIVS